MQAAVKFESKKIDFCSVYVRNSLFRQKETAAPDVACLLLLLFPSTAEQAERAYLRRKSCRSQTTRATTSTVHLTGYHPHASCRSHLNFVLAAHRAEIRGERKKNLSLDEFAQY
jgi:hypothetical protein